MMYAQMYGGETAVMSRHHSVVVGFSFRSIFGVTILLLVAGIIHFIFKIID